MPIRDRVVEKDIQPAKTRGSIGDHLPAGAAIGDVGCQEPGVPAGGPDLLRDSVP